MFPWIFVGPIPLTLTVPPISSLSRFTPLLSKSVECVGGIVSGPRKGVLGTGIPNFEGDTTFFGNVDPGLGMADLAAEVDTIGPVFGTVDPGLWTIDAPEIVDPGLDGAVFIEEVVDTCVGKAF